MYKYDKDVSPIYFRSYNLFIIFLRLETIISFNRIFGGRKTNRLILIIVFTITNVSLNYLLYNISQDTLILIAASISTI